MYYIHQTPNSAGNYGNPMGEPFDGCLALPDELLPAYIQANGFVTIAVQDDTVTSVEKNEAAWEAWNAAQPPVDLDALRAAKQEQNKKALADFSFLMVTRTRFELVNDAVKGRCVKPLHQRAKKNGA